MSTDLEDIVLLLDGCPNLEENFQQADTEVITFVKGWFKSELNLLTAKCIGILNESYQYLSLQTIKI
jgi:hypothetical protein